MNENELKPENKKEVAKKPLSKTAVKTNEVKIKNIFEKLSDFRNTVNSIAKDANNPHFKSKYSSIESVIEAITKPMAESGLVFTQTILDQALTTKIIDIDSGETIESVLPLINPKGDMQGLGSAITYARRYSLVTMLGLIQEDDDGNLSSKSNGNNNQAKKNSYRNENNQHMGDKRGTTMPPMPQLINQGQHDKLRVALNEKGLDYNSVCANWGIKSLMELQVNSISNFNNWLAKA